MDHRRIWLNEEEIYFRVSLLFFVFLLITCGGEEKEAGKCRPAESIWQREWICEVIYKMKIWQSTIKDEVLGSRETLDMKTLVDADEL